MRASTASAARRLCCSPAARARCFTSPSAASRSQPLAPCAWRGQQWGAGALAGRRRHHQPSPPSRLQALHTSKRPEPPPAEHLAVYGRQQRSLQPVCRPPLNRNLRRRGRRAGQRRRHRRCVLAAALARPSRRAGRPIPLLLLQLLARCGSHGRRRQRGGCRRGAGATWRRGGSPHGGILCRLRLCKRLVVWRAPGPKRAALQHRCARAGSKNRVRQARQDQSSPDTPAARRRCTQSTSHTSSQAPRPWLPALAALPPSMMLRRT